MRFPIPIRTAAPAAAVLLAAVLGAASPAGAHLTASEVPSLAPLVQGSAPAVVNIATRGEAQRRRHPFFDDPFFRRFFGDRPRPQPRPREGRSVGSGVIVDAARGYLLTNQHVVANADEIVVTLADRRRLEAELVGADPDTDIAVLKVEPDSLTALPFADSDELEVGDHVLAIGNPFGLGQTVTSGIVSAVGRSGLGIESYEDFIQTDASINPGNSGGALINLKGALVGINTAIIAPGGGNVGIGFAIPINMARRVMDMILTHGEIRRGRIGVQIQDLTPELAEAFSVGDRRGAVVSQVVPDTPAEAAGLRPGDVIVEMNGEPVAGSADLRNKVGMLRIGDAVRLALVRDGRRMEVALEVGEVAEAKLQPGSRAPRLEGAVFGRVLEDSPLYGKVDGVLVVEVEGGSPAWNAGLREGDVITTVNLEQVREPEDVLRLAGAADGPLLLNIRRGDGALFLLIR